MLSYNLNPRVLPIAYNTVFVCIIHSIEILTLTRPSQGLVYIVETISYDYINIDRLTRCHE